MIKIALTNLGKYNEGQLIYQWLELPATEEEIEEAKEAIGINDEYEEFFISDYESEIAGITIDEYENIEELNDLAEEAAALDNHERIVLEAIIEAEGNNLESALETILNGDYEFYEANSLEDLAEQMVDEGYFGDTSQMGQLSNYIDYERLGRDLGCDGYVEVSNGVIRVH